MVYNNISLPFLPHPKSFRAADRSSKEKDFFKFNHNSYYYSAATTWLNSRRSGNKLDMSMYSLK